jgi:hypothetical protein
MLRCFSQAGTFEIPAHIEVIGNRAFSQCYPGTVIFGIGSKLRVISEGAFYQHYRLRAITVLSSVEILGDRCFESCWSLTTVTFEEPSRLKKIGDGLSPIARSTHSQFQHQ